MVKISSVFHRTAVRISFFFSLRACPFVVWYWAEEVYPGMRFRNYVGDDIVIGDTRVADVYKDVIQRLGVNLSLPKSLVSDIGGLEFAKKFL